MADSRRLSALAEVVLAAADTPQGPCVVALSGGPDSAICAWVAVQAGGSVRAVHVDHGFAGSPVVRKAAIAVAAQLDIPLRIVEVAVGDGSSPEGQARAARYEALEAALGPGEFLCTGHTRTDQAETVLGNLLRGAGGDGLSGIPRHRGRIVRPILDVTRSQTRELATLLALPWVEDPANLDVGPRRNLLRREAIPYLEERFNPSLESALARTAELLSVENDYLDREADRVPIQVGGSAIRLPGPLLVTIDDAIAARVVRKALRLIGGPHAGDARDVHLVLRVAEGSTENASLTGGAHAERNGALVLISRTARTAPEPVEWTLPGRVRFGDWALEAWTTEATPTAYPPSRLVEVFDASAIPPVVTVRGVSAGDLIGFSGGHKDVAIAMAEVGISAAQRRAWPTVVAAESGTLWVPGVRRADAGWVDSTTSRYLWLRATLEDA